MQTVSIETLKEGATLASDVRDSTGQLLMPLGVVLTEKHLEMLQARGVLEVCIEGDLTQEPPLDPKWIERAQKELKESFALVDMDKTVMKVLHEVCVMRRAKKLAKERSV